MTETAGRLLELLGIRDAEIEALHGKLQDQEREMDFGLDWMRHADVGPEVDHLSLPLPRLELRVLDVQEYHLESQVALVLSNRGGRARCVPLSYGKRSGDSPDFSSFPTEGTLSDHQVWDLPGLVNDLCFQSEQLRLPAFVVLDSTHAYSVACRPLSLTAVPAPQPA